MHTDIVGCIVGADVICCLAVVKGYTLWWSAYAVRLIRTAYVNLKFGN